MPNPRMIAVTLHRGNEAQKREVAIHHAVVAGWTGRDKVALEKHIVELEHLGVKRPASTPIFYRVSASRLTTDRGIEVSGGDSSGEVEFVLLKTGGRLWVGTGSDHTDRQVETYNVTVSKQMCDKPIAGEFWDLEEVAGHWDQLTLSSWIIEKGERVLYQQGSVAAMLAPQDLLALWNNGELDEGTLMFCGTLAAKGGIRPAPRFEFELADPVKGRKIAHGYGMTSLAVVG
ncbi:MAG TPA: DUF2848 domain-containing protein [Stellaceae bacterium]|nr:DUF2848 domain-containing protein [Stellaceae bacterium]